MLNAMRSWTGWDCTALPADGAEVNMLNGIPPATELPISEENSSLEVLFCRQGGFQLVMSNGRRL